MEYTDQDGVMVWQCMWMSKGWPHGNRLCCLCTVPAANTVCSQKEHHTHLAGMWPRLPLPYFLMTQAGAQAHGYHTWLKLKVSLGPLLTRQIPSVPWKFPNSQGIQHLPDLEVPSVPNNWDQKPSGIQAWEGLYSEGSLPSGLQEGIRPPVRSLTSLNPMR